MGWCTWHRGSVICRLVEMNVIKQVDNLGKTRVIRNAWTLGRRHLIDGRVFNLASSFRRWHTQAIVGDDAIHAVCGFHGTGSRAMP